MAKTVRSHMIGVIICKIWQKLAHFWQNFTKNDPKKHFLANNFEIGALRTVKYILEHQKTPIVCI